MRFWKRIVVGYTVVLLVTGVASTLAYDWGMTALDGRPRTLLESLRFVVETYTATGYGSDAPWSSPWMQTLVIAIDVTGTLLFFLALPVFVLPVFRDWLQQRVPEHLSDQTANHVVVASHSERMEPLLDELDSWDVEYAIVEPDREAARELYRDGEPAIHADPDEVEGLAAANLRDARALVVDVEDRMDASIVLTARELDEDVRVVSVVEQPDSARYHELAGADAVLSPRPLLGERLARTATSAVRTDLGDVVELGEDFHVVEVPVPRGSELVGRTIAESGLRERASVDVIGAWFRDEFESPPPADARIEEGTVLLVAGHEAAIDHLADLTAGRVRPHERDDAVVVGHGQVGRTVTERLEDAGVPYTVVDREPGPDVDVVGDGTDPEVLRQAGVGDAASLVLAIPDDAETEFATLVARDESERINVAARADDTGSVRKLYRAGADYVLSLDRITGRLLASTVLEGEDVLASDAQVEIVRVDAGELAGATLEAERVGERTGCTVLAVERAGEVHTDLAPDFRIEADDQLVVAGSDTGVNRFTELFE